MKTLLLAIALGGIARITMGTQADDVTITVTGKTAGATPFLSQVTLAVSDTSAVKSIQFTVASKPVLPCVRYRRFTPVVTWQNAET
jgi:hypothetical protein